MDRIFPKDKVGWPILIGAVVRVKPELTRAYTGKVVNAGPQVVSVKDKGGRTRYARPECCKVKRPYKRRQAAVKAIMSQLYKE